MKSDAYWGKRLDALNEAQLNKAEKYIKTMQDEYSRSLAKIESETRAWYSRFANNNGIIDMAEARKLLNSGELKELKWTVQDYIKAGRENAVDQRWMKELENASAKVHITRLEAKQIQLRQEIELLSGKKLTSAESLLGGVYKDNYYKSIYELQKGIGVGTSFTKLDNNQIEKILSSPWAPDGKNFSSRIWSDRTKLLSEMTTVLTQNLTSGAPIDELITNFAKRMGVSRGHAENLILTEAAFFSGQSRLDAYKELNVKDYKNFATLDRKTSDTCRKMDGTVFLVSDAQAGVNYPPFHNRCRTTTIPHFDGNVQERVAESEDKQVYSVPGDITYKEWADKYAPNEAEFLPNTNPIKAIEPPKVKTVEPIPGSVTRRFSNAVEADAWNAEVAPQWISSLTRDERIGIKLYSGDSYNGINERLRGGSVEKWDSIVQTISSALQKSQLQESITVYRAADDLFSMPVVELPGHVITENAFMSTSLLGNLFAKSAIQMEIVVPKGAPGSPIMWLSSYEDEYEFLLDKGTRYVILEAVEVNGIIKVKAEVLLDHE
ncbi:ADP-ribosyltransferase [Cohnella silvisoli]|uniref:Minor capsid protein n=1 Tax=Cohnella silvisoli TaxID=2873699 RepID=A0ABV1L2Y5_9BACL|nr:ADP-ribosyltransferase [Cohnella silvisoli]MCD9026039.1 minor capsid protein [Cohnella silvisoli]